MVKIKNFISSVSQKVLTVAIYTSMFLAMSTSNAFAADTPTIVTGTEKLFQTGTTWLLGIIPAAAGCMLGYQASQKSLTDDEGVIAQRNKFMKNVVKGAVVAECASGIITAVLSFYTS